MDQPFLRMDDPTLPEILTDAAFEVLAVRGLAEFSVAALARWMKVTPEAVTNVYKRSRVIELVTGRFTRRWLEWLVAHDERATPLPLPRSEHELHAVRVRVALTELARGERMHGHPLPAQHLERLRTDEYALLCRRLEQSVVSADDPSRRLGKVVSDREARTVMTLLDGLRLALADQPPSLSYGEAVDVLRGHLRPVADEVSDLRLPA